MHENLVILAGGMSSRMKKPTKSNSVNEEEINQANNRSKSLISVGNTGRPLMDYLLYNAKKAGYKNIYIVINEKGGLFKKYYGENKANNNFKGLNISFPIQYIPENRIKPFGTADAVLQAVEQFPELQSQQFTVCNSDNLYSQNALRKLRQIHNPCAFISYNRETLEFSIEKIYSFAVMKLDDNNFLKNIIEKPTLKEANECKNNDEIIRVSMNIFKMDGNLIYRYFKNCPIHPIRNEKEIPTVVLNCVKDNPQAFLAIPLSEHVPDLTAKDDIKIIKEYLKQHYPNTLNW